MLKIEDMKKILKENEINFFSYWDKKKFIEVLKEHNLYPEEEKKEKIKKEKNFDRLKDIAKNPRKVTLKDVETEEVHEFPSIFKAGKFLNHCPQTIENWNGRVWKNKYRIDIQ